MAADNLTSARDNKAYVPWWIYILLVGILVIATLSRVWLLRVTPGWYADEGSEIEIATHLMNGEQRYFAIGQSTLVVARLPLFHTILASLFAVFGRDILTLRMVTVTYGLLIVFLLFVLGRHMWGTRLALIAAAMYAIYPNAVLYNRFGFFYNQLALLNLLLFYTLWRFVTGGTGWWLVAACLSVGLSLMTSVASLPTIGFVVLILFLTRRSALWPAVALLACIPALYGISMMIRAPQAFLDDLRYIFFDRLGGGALYKTFFAVWNYKQLLLWDAWVPLGAFGLTRLRPSQTGLYTQAFFWYTLFTIVAGVPAVIDLGYHYMLPLLPWVAVGVAAFVIWASPRLIAGLEDVYDRLYTQLPWAKAKGKWNNWVRHQGRAWIVGLALFWVVISPFVAMGVQARFLPGLATPAVERVTVRDIQDAEAAVAYVNHHTEQNDVVLAPPHVAWMIEAHAADFQQSAAYMGGETQNYPKGIDRSRFLFDCSIANAKYVLLWDGWREWAGRKMPDVEKIFQVVETWPVVYEQGEWRVFANPES